MRFIGILIVLLSLPLFIGWLKGNPGQRKWAYFSVGLAPFLMGALNLDVAFINWAGWPGYAKGLVVTILDTLALALIILHRGSFQRLPLLIPLVLYLLAALLSVAFSNLWQSSSFYVFQLVRMVIVFVAVSSFAGRPQALRSMALGLAAGAVFQAVVTIDQRFSGVVQAPGTMGHQNLLGLMLHFVTLPLIAILLGGERSKLLILGVIGGLIAVALGASRGAIAFVGLGIVILFALSMIRSATPRKWKIFGLACVMAMAIVPMTLQSFAERFDGRQIYDGPDLEREAFENAAKAMWSDHPMGVGANQYVVTANTEGYSERAGVTWARGSRNANVHNVYLLTAAETGWFGLFALVGLFAWSVCRGLLFAFSYRRSWRGDVVLGATVAVLINAIHGFFEWVFVSYNAQYVFVIALGIIAGNIRENGREKELKKRDVFRRMNQREVQARALNPKPQTEVAL